MTRFPSMLRGAAIGALALLAACSGTTDFTVTKDFNASSTAAAGYEATQAVDLAADAPDAWKHRSKIKKLELVGLDGTVTSITSPAGGFTGDGEIWLFPDGVTSTSGAGAQQLGAWSSVAVTAAPHTLSVTLTPGAIAVLENALRTNGRFAVHVEGGTQQDAVFGARVALHVKLTYKVP
jgi:hypothetical protein